jgi:uncharacterized protein (DUF433 family)
MRPRRLRLSPKACRLDRCALAAQTEVMVDWRVYIVADPEVLVGKPVLQGTRISVDFVLELLASGHSTEDVLREHPTLRLEHVQACLAYAAEIVKSERVIRLPA